MVFHDRLPLPSFTIAWFSDPCPAGSIRKYVLVELGALRDIVCVVSSLRRKFDCENVCADVHILACQRAREAITDPEVGEIVRVPSLFDTDETPATSAVILPFNFCIAESILSAAEIVPIPEI